MAKSSKAKAAKSKKLVASASRPLGRKKGRRTMNENAVKLYAAELAAALGIKTFEDVFNRLKNDASIKQDEAVAIAAILLDARVAASTSRSTALERILKLHNSLATFKLKQRAVGGRSAA